MMAIMISFTVVIALFLFLVPGGLSFTTGVGTTPAIHPSWSTATAPTRIHPTQLYGKRKRIKKKIKEIIGAGGGGDGGAPEGDEAAAAAVVDETTPMPKVEVGTTTPSPSVVDTTDGSEGKKVKLSERKANQLSKKYEDIDNLEEQAYQVLVDLGMV